MQKVVVFNCNLLYNKCMKVEKEVVMNEVGICPVCSGSGRRSADGVSAKTVYAGYDKETDTLPCNNCGGQTMYGRPTGEVSLRKDGTPCKHEYNSTNVGRCLTRYNCVHCTFSFNIDSGD